MAIWAFLLHLANFVWPAAVVAGLLAFAVLWRQGQRGGQPWSRRWVRIWALLAGMGGAVLLVGLIAYGRDGKVGTYAALVLAQGSLAAWLRQRR